MTKHDAATQSATAELVITRVLDAPRELVWKAWTEPERLVQWWGAKGSTILVKKMELRPGGVFHYCQQMPNGGEMWGRFLYHEIVPPERLVFSTTFADAEGNVVRAPFSADWPLEILNTLTLTEADGKTTVAMRGAPVNATEAELQTFAAAKPNIQQGFKGTFEQLEAYLARA